MTDQGTITIVPSVHFSRTHRRRVRETILEEEPDLVAVELDERRFERIDRDGFADSAELSRDLPPATAMTYQLLRTIQRSVVRLYGLDPETTDMETAIETAASIDTEVALIDEPIADVVAELSDRVGFETIPKLMIRAGSMGPADRLQQLEVLTVPFDRIESGDDVQPMIDQFRRLLPEVAEVMIDRRDRAMANRLHVLRRSGYDVVAVVGAGHHNGISRALEELEASEVDPAVDVPIEVPSREVTRIPIE